MYRYWPRFYAHHQRAQAVECLIHIMNVQSCCHRKRFQNNFFLLGSETNRYLETKSQSKHVTEIYVAKGKGWLSGLLSPSTWRSRVHRKVPRRLRTATPVLGATLTFVGRPCFHRKISRRNRAERE